MGSSTHSGSISGGLRRDTDPGAYPDLNGATPLAEFAARQISGRLRLLAREARHSLDAPDPDAVHDLRVAIRRYTQGLILFEDLLPKQSVRRVRGHLKDMMLLTSEVRNRDIALEYLGSISDSSSKDEDLKNRLRSERSRHSAAMHGALRAWSKEDFPRSWGEAFDFDFQEWSGGKWEPHRSAAENAARRLPRMTAKYFQAGKYTAKKSEEAAELHSFRVKTKRFRYALEIFEPVYGPQIHDLLERLHELQKILGDISDAATIAELLYQDRFRKRLQKKERKKIRAFRQYWRQVFNAPGQLEIWEQALSAVPATV